MKKLRTANEITLARNVIDEAISRRNIEGVLSIDVPPQGEPTIALDGHFTSDELMRIVSIVRAAVRM